ncbi:putative leader peptide [Streptomyces sp. NBC_00442]|uniref:putative leader peptide n=1 Tax=Streptomyces sp. NBC_00442 TaxID=2903651 RepID=UPI003FA6AD7F
MRGDGLPRRARQGPFVSGPADERAEVTVLFPHPTALTPTARVRAPQVRATQGHATQICAARGCVHLYSRLHIDLQRVACALCRS